MSTGIRPDGRGRWIVRVGATDPRTGRLVRRQRLVLGTRKEAETARLALRAEIESGREDGHCVPRLREYIEVWLRRAKQRVRVGTYEGYRYQLSFPIAAIGPDVYLDRITRGDVEDLVRRMREEGLAPATINRTLVLGRRVLADASDEYGIPDPSRRVRALPEPRTREGLTIDQLRAALAAAREHQGGRHYALVLTLALTGLRWSEVSALQWCDIDPDHGVIRVRRSHYKGRLRDATKTGGHRTAPLVAPVAEALQARREQLLREQSPGLEAGWIWWTRTRRGGRAGDVVLLDQSGVQPLWDVLAAAAGVESCRPHVLRRTYVDLQRRAQVDVIVARATVGHGGEDMTAHYSTVRDDEVAEAGVRVLRLVES